MRYLFSLKLFCVWLGSKTQDRTQNPTQNPESKMFDPKPSPKPVVLGLGRKTQKKPAQCPPLVITPAIPQRLYPTGALLQGYCVSKSGLARQITKNNI